MAKNDKNAPDRDAPRQDPSLREMPENYTLEDILEEYRSLPLPAPQEQTASPGPPPRTPPEGPGDAPLPEEGPPSLRAAEDLARLQEMVGPNRDDVLSDDGRRPISLRRPGLFSRRQDTETLPPPPEEPPEPSGPLSQMHGEREPALSAVAVDSREDLYAADRALRRSLLLALPFLALLGAEYGGATIPYWSGDKTIQGPVYLAALLLSLLACRPVALYALRRLWGGRLTGHLFALLSVLAAAADCIVWMLVPQRGQTPPYAPAALLALCFAQWGVCRELQGDHECFRTAAMDDCPPYMVAETPRGACKQRGSASGFYTVALRLDMAGTLQAVFLPLIFAASLVFSVLMALEWGQREMFFLNWSALLLAGGTYSLPLCWALPWASVAKRQQRSGCAVAGWDGARRISRRRRLILTDTDLFPPGTIHFNGVRLYGETLPKAAAYAAAMASAAGSGLGRVFADLAAGEGAPPETAEGVDFYEEGGWEGTIRGESVLMGTASFFMKRGIRLPDVTLPTGIFLAADGELMAVFAVKYEAAENVDYALRVLRRSRIMPILAARDPNITPALLKRKFHRWVRVSFPGLTERIALSEAREDRGLPLALLMREGLLPYAEAVAGSRRLRTAVYRSTWLSLIGSGVGTLLTAYLLSLEKFELLTPASFVAFLLLWTLPVLLIGDWAGRF